MGLGEVAIAALPTGICPKPAFSDSLGGNLMVVLWLLYASILPAQRLYFQLQKTL